MRIYIILFSLLFICSGQAYNFSSNDLFSRLHREAPGLSYRVFKTSYIAYENAKRMGVTRSNILTIIDFSMASKQRRMFVIDMRKDNVVIENYVANGTNSGANFATHFSNRASSHETSIGVYKTGSQYVGEHGTSLRLYGLDKGFNNNAYKRAIVVHGAAYVSNSIAEHYSRLGRSFGCFAVSQRLVKPIINIIKNGSIIVAYYPDAQWLARSSFLKHSVV